MESNLRPTPRNSTPLLSQWTHSTTCHGVSEVVNGRQIASKGFWLFSVLFSAVLIIYQVAIVDLRKAMSEITGLSSYQERRHASLHYEQQLLRKHRARR